MKRISLVCSLLAVLMGTTAMNGKIPTTPKIPQPIKYRNLDPSVPEPGQTGPVTQSQPPKRLYTPGRMYRPGDEADLEAQYQRELREYNASGPTIYAWCYNVLKDSFGTKLVSYPIASATSADECKNVAKNEFGNICQDYGKLKAPNLKVTVWWGKDGSYAFKDEPCPNP